MAETLPVMVQPARAGKDGKGPPASLQYGRRRVVKLDDSAFRDQSSRCTFSRNDQHNLAWSMCRSRSDVMVIISAYSSTSTGALGSPWKAYL